jgi:hypothetical protein
MAYIGGSTELTTGRHTVFGYLVLKHKTASLAIGSFRTPGVRKPNLY